ncbi:MAG: hypothetical protein HY901_10460, partial [Deltaproteobacteria bacterium]|nr:hypothetical protein [Deltaproteobacteria bacterium]
CSDGFFCPAGWACCGAGTCCLGPTQQPAQKGTAIGTNAAPPTPLSGTPANSAGSGTTPQAGSSDTDGCSSDAAGSAAGGEGQIGLGYACSGGSGGPSLAGVAVILGALRFRRRRARGAGSRGAAGAGVSR